MRCSRDMLLDYLGKTFEGMVVCMDGTPDFDLTQPVWLTCATRLEGGSIYLCDSALDFGPGDVSPGCLLLCCDVAIDAPCTVARFGPDVSLPDVLNSIHRYLEELRAWGERLQVLADGGGSLQQMLDASCALLQNPLSLIDSNYQFIAFSGAVQNTHSMQVLSVGGDERVILAPDFIHELRQQVERNFFETQPFFHQSDYGRSMNLNLFYENIYLGTLGMVEQNSVFLPHAGAMMRYLANFCLPLLLQYHLAGDMQQSLRTLLCAIATGTIPDGATEQLRLYRYAPASRFTAVCVDTDCWQSPIPLSFFQLQLEGLFDGGIVIPYQNRHLLIIDTLRVALGSHEMLTAVEKAVRQNDLYAGICNVFSDILQLASYAVQANAALQLGKQQGEGRVFCFGDFAEDYVMQLLQQDLGVPLICADGIAALQEHDRYAQVSYCDTLLVYLQCGRNTARAAEQLGIRRNTMLSRLERILKMVDIDLEDEQQAFLLDLSLRML
ncbi:helix-turn-helix domain-containing protein [Eubacteriales bacterium OttesenSCG-928-N14]|nr:helix-turn-helix domain-containing protein [Eubacteriales bacterium OttesenSCG-928-N14]